ncbi:hypothetical protein NUW58_g4260 [Xylaria curta]|uniref:Uncharacterized protein n=1 Tax=Xylaria curta TaxID=42375 RepID=A0ACC1P9G9_9PEZI|nr:hypothetical protein NUW58_g4260 [Xylaria curta]
MQNPMERGESVAYVDERYRTLTQAESSYQRKTFSFENPHTCCHCEDVFITLDTQAWAVVCSACFWKGVGEPTTDGQYRLCGQCSRLYEDQKERKYSATLSYNLLEAIAASKEGCALYEWLVDLVVLNIVKRGGWRMSEILLSTAYKFHLSAVAFGSDRNPGCVLKVEFKLANATKAGTTPGFSLSYDLQGWTTAADPAAKYISCRPYEPDVKCNRSINFARGCFQECLENHDRCISFLTDKSDLEGGVPGLTRALARETVDIAHVPSRLIYASSEIEQFHVVLIETREAPDEITVDISRSGFAALSYCWGGDQPLTLTKASHQDLKTSILVSKLPQTLQDAVWVTRKMEMRYLWIDALCILQDSDEDKASEIARMSTYYSCAKLTICAAAASGSTEGFLHVRDNDVGLRAGLQHWARHLWENQFLFYSVTVVFVTIFPAIYIPGLNHVVFLHDGITWEWAVVFVATGFFFVLVEAWKWAKRVYYRQRRQQSMSKGDAAQETV